MTENSEPGRNESPWLMVNEYGDVVVPSEAEFMAAMQGTPPKGYRFFEVKAVDVDSHGHLVLRVEPNFASVVLDALENDLEHKRIDVRALSLIEGIKRALRRVKSGGR